MSNPIGVNTWVWVSPLTDERLAELAPKVAEWGFDFLELPIEGLEDWDPNRARSVLDDQGLGATVVCAMSPDRDLTSTDEDVVAGTQEYLRACVDRAATVGSKVVAGPLYAPVGKTWPMSDSERPQLVSRVADNLRPVCEYGKEHGVKLAIEPINRFETSVFNTVDQVVELVTQVDSEGCGILCDTFHMNIEEKDPAAAIVAAGDHLAHVHACGSDRGAPGNDHTDWGAFAAALGKIGYEGTVCIESFTIENQSIARAAAIWRRLEPSQDAIAEDGLRHLARLLNA